MVTTAEEYNKKVNETVTVTLKSGNIFVIRKSVPARKLLPKILPLIGDISKNMEEKAEALFNKLSDEDKLKAIDLGNFKIVLAVADPQLSMEKTDDNKVIWIDDVIEEDYQELQKLTEEITYGKEITDPLSEADRLQD